MIEHKGDIWTFRQPDDHVVITTNNTIRRDGALVMGRGIALEACSKYPRLQFELGNRIRQFGLRVEHIRPHKLIIFPVKFHYRDSADINLILRSTLQLLTLAEEIEGRILMPRPGCGYGHLDWAEVGPMMNHYLTSDKFIVFSKDKSAR